MNRIETIAIGDEILTGKISDTNSSFVAQKLLQIGLTLSEQRVIPDDETIIKETLLERARVANFVICFGGLGPTSDDKTARCVADLLGCELVEDPHAKERMIKIYTERKRVVTAPSLKQVLCPSRAEALRNEEGFAPGITCQLEGAKFFFLPGIPAEMRAMFVHEVIPRILKFCESGERLLTKSFHCYGIHESELQGVLDPLEKRLPKNVYFGYRSTSPENHAVLYVRSKSESDRKLFEDYAQQMQELLAPWIYSDNGDSIERTLIARLKKSKKRLVLVESCTGGLAAHRLTQISGASEVFWGGFTSYQLDAKQKMLGVNLPSEEAAVTRDAAQRLAREAKIRSGCEIAASIVGFMGPTGGNSKDPIGTIYHCVFGETFDERRHELLRKGDRVQLQSVAASHLLHHILSCLE